ncbi:hypothetical protein MMC20_005895 [Loxospora ochrophaea]|nr:hypothetical protein [Loxospora ochrophaea]
MEHYLRDSDPKDDDDWKRNDWKSMLINLTITTFAFAHVKELSVYSSLPLSLNYLGDCKLEEQLFWTNRAIGLDEASIFYYIAMLLVSGPFYGDDYKGVFLISDFGWSLFLNSVGDNDPGDSRPALLHIKPGVPVNNRLERKTRIRDTQEFIRNLPSYSFADGGETYVPRCETRITERSEYYGTRSKEFLLSIMFRADGQPTMSEQMAEATSSYRYLNEALWSTKIIGHEACSHFKKFLELARFGPDVVTTKGFKITGKVGREELAQRVHIRLIKGDSRTRWLAVRQAGLNGRKAALRKNDCCENFAVDAIMSLPGDWNLII